jgi:hypothetical protein
MNKLTITYEQCTNYELQVAMEKLTNMPTDGKTAYRIKTINAELKKARVKISDEYEKEICEKYAERDAEGKYDRQTFKPKKEMIADFKKDQDEFGKRTVEIERPKLTMADIKDTKLTANDLEALEPILDDSDAEKAEPKKGPKLQAAVGV